MLSAAPRSGHRTAAVPFRPLEAPGTFALVLDTRALHPGSHYRLCTDLDGLGANATLGTGDSSLEIYASGVTLVSNPAIATSVPLGPARVWVGEGCAFRGVEDVCASRMVVDIEMRS